VMTGPITVSTSLGTNTTSSYFYVPPTLSGLAPASGRLNTNVVLTGTSFLGTTGVTFNVPGVACTNFTVLNNTNLVAPVPAGASSGPIRVVAPNGSVVSGTFTVLPVITNFVPASGPAGTSVTIRGANFNVGTPVVRFNGVQASVSGVTFGQLTAVVPSTTSGPVSITTSDGSHTNATFFYLPASITSFAPSNSLPGTSVTISGQNFLGTTSVQFNGQAAAFNTPTNNTLLVATVPPGVTSGPITVTTPAGPISSSGLFYGAPGITGFNPTHGLPGTPVTIFGSNFLGATAVIFTGAAPVTPGVQDNYTIQVQVPGGALTGPITVVAPAGSNITATPFSLDYQIDLLVAVYGPTNPVTVGSNMVYIISTGNNSGINAPNVRVTNTFNWVSAPTGLVAVIKSVTTPQGTLTLTSNGFTGNLGTIIAGGFVNVTLTLAAQITNGLLRTEALLLESAGAGCDYPDPLPYNNSAAIVTSVLPLPLLSIRQVPTNQVRLAWPSALTNYTLQYRTSLSPDVFWFNDLAPSVTNNENVVLESGTNGMRFFRLRQH